MSNHVKRISKLATTLLLFSLLIACSKDEEINPVTQNDPTITASPIDENNSEADNQSIENTSKEDVPKQIEPTESITEDIASEENLPAEDTPNDSIPDSTDLSAQIEIIINNTSQWATPMDYANDAYFYAVTDLNNNGKLEIISSNIGGTGQYTYSNYYEINDTFDGLISWQNTLEEGDSQADISDDSITAYYDPSSGRTYYIFHDLAKDGPAKYYENKRAIYYEDNKINEVFLAYRTTIYTDADDEFTPNITITDKDNNPITEDIYNNIGDLYYPNYEKKTVTFGWHQVRNPEDLTSLSKDELYKLLENSYQGFTVK